MEKKFESYSDDALVRSFSEGSSDAFDTLVERYDAPLHTYIRMQVGDAFLADDIFQDSFIKAIQRIREGKYSHQGKFKSWLYRIAHNLIMDHFRHEKVRNVVSLSDDSEDVAFVEKLPTPELNIEELLCKQNERNLIRQMVAMLPKEQRDVLLMRYLYEMSFKDIADRTGVSINTALGRMRYALINLRKHQSIME